jgi:NAD-dependent SIR2 family protein deacetylase
MLPTNDLQQAREWLQNADHILIGAGAGLSSAAGIDYAGEAFQREFADMIARYGFGDLYSASFYPYPTEEEFWASWARHVLFARFNNGLSSKDEPGKYTEALPLYQQLLKLVCDKDYFVITTNVDGQFRKAGFDAERLFEVQGDYAYLQGKTGKSGKVYYSEELFRQMVREEQNGRIPTALIPRDPESGEKMDIHVRKDLYFVEDEEWQRAQNNYYDWLECNISGQSTSNVVLLELGVGFNTPTIIRFPFERLVNKYRGVRLIRFNRDYPSAQLPLDHFIGLTDLSTLFLHTI